MCVGEGRGGAQHEVRARGARAAGKITVIRFTIQPWIPRVWMGMALKKLAFLLLSGKNGLSHLNSKAENKDLNHTIQNGSPCRISVLDRAR